jgi:fumarylacetoacetate (FAA) hydrolase family protein
MKLCRFLSQNQIRIGVLNDNETISNLSSAGVAAMTPLLEREDLAEYLKDLLSKKLPEVSASEVRLLPPVERQEVWAVGVTYLRSKKARMEESDFSATAYDKVYDAPRPELFFKSMPEKVVGPGDTVGIRRDATWNVPEPELALVLNSRGEIVGFTVGNDMSSRDIEGKTCSISRRRKFTIAPAPWVRASWSEQMKKRRAGGPSACKFRALETWCSQAKRPSRKSNVPSPKWRVICSVRRLSRTARFSSRERV